MDQAVYQSTTSRSRFHHHALPDAIATLLAGGFIDQIVNVDQSQSLIDYVNRFKTTDTVIFADVDELEVHAVIDYHIAGSAKPGLAEHHAVLNLSHSAEWETWVSIGGKLYDQRSFARLLDVNSDDIVSATEAERSTNGTALPPFFLLSIPVFAGEPKVAVKAMTKDDIDGTTSKVSFGLELVRTRLVIETEFARIAHQIAAATSVPVILGSVKD